MQTSQELISFRDNIPYLVLKINDLIQQKAYLTKLNLMNERAVRDFERNLQGVIEKAHQKAKRFNLKLSIPE